MTTSDTSDERIFHEMNIAQLFSPEFLGILEMIGKDATENRRAVLIAQSALLLIAKKIAPASGLPITITEENGRVVLRETIPVCGMEFVPLFDAIGNA